MKLSYVIPLSKTDFKAVAQGDWRKMINYLGRLGYNGIELAIRKPKEVPVEALSKVLKTNHMYVPALGTGQAYLFDNLSLSSIDKQIRHRAIQRIEEHMRLAKVFAADVIIGLILFRLWE